MSLLDRVGRLHRTELIRGIADASLYHLKTPRHCFTSVVFGVNERLGVISCRDGFDVAVAKRVLEAVRSLPSLPDESSPIVKAPLNSGGASSFNAIYVLDATAHDMYRAEDVDLHQFTVVSFPGYRCEFSGDESAATLKVMRRDLIPTLDWTRAPHPKVLLSYSNTRTLSRSVRKAPALATAEVLYREIRNLAGAEGSWLELENFSHIRCRVEVGDGYVVTQPGKEIQILNDVNAVLDAIQALIDPECVRP